MTEIIRVVAQRILVSAPGPLGQIGSLNFLGQQSKLKNSFVSVYIL